MATPQQTMSSSAPMLQAPQPMDMDVPVVAGGCGCCCSTVPTGSVGIVQHCGEFIGVQEPGCACYCPCVRDITHVSLAVQQMVSQSECKTKDNVTVIVETSVQYRIRRNMVKVAHFDIVNPHQQMKAYIDNVLRSFVPTLDLDDVYSAKEHMTNHILDSVQKSMNTYGYDVVNVLITDLRPEASVLRAMNDINASRRQREAAVEKGEADKILKIKASEADAEAMHLAGVGMAQMRKAVADGFKESMVSMEAGGITSKEAMHLMITTQYLDTLKEFANGKSSIMVPHGPGAVSDISKQVRDGFLGAEALK